MADEKEKVENFISVTGADETRAKFYLESSAWNVELAISSFFEGDDVEAEAFQNMETEEPPKSSSQGTGRIQTFGHITVEDDSSDEEGQAYYAGGSDRSGQQVIGPPKKKDSNKVVDNLLRSAKEHGAEERREDEAPVSSTARPVFMGSGYRLGMTETDSTVIQGASAATARGTVDKKLKLWKNGFSVDDGPLRDYQDPENKQFLSSVSKGEIPVELLKESQGREVNLDMEDRRGEDYTKPKVTVKAFSGAGHMLGSPAPDISNAPTTKASGDSPPSPVQVDDSKPVTNVQLRLADGRRLVLRLNHCHKICDIRQHIVVTNPQYTQSSFVLMTTFPNKELTDESQTLENANLLNAVIVQRIK